MHGSCVSASFINNQKGGFHAKLIRESWEGKRKVILVLLKPLKIIFDDNTITYKINHCKLLSKW